MKHSSVKSKIALVMQTNIWSDPPAGIRVLWLHWGGAPHSSWVSWRSSRLLGSSPATHTVLTVEGLQSDCILLAQLLCLIRCPLCELLKEGSKGKFLPWACPGNQRVFRKRSQKVLSLHKIMVSKWAPCYRRKCCFNVCDKKLL